MENQQNSFETEYDYNKKVEKSTDDSGLLLIVILLAVLSLAGIFALLQI